VPQFSVFSRETVPNVRQKETRLVEQSSKQIGIEHFGAHDLRRTCAKLCRKNGGDLEQIKFLLGHSSIQATERYLGSEQDIEIAVNDNLGL
jgi:integrase